MSKAVGVMLDGEITWHAGGIASDYETLCGLDANDPAIGHGGTVKAAKTQKIDCAQCFSMWWNIRALKLRKSDFKVKP